MSLNNRISRLEQQLQNRPCACPNNADLAWPGQRPDGHCATCGGERLIYVLNHHPGDAEHVVRGALPILAKTYDGTNQADYSNLTDEELQGLKHALQAAERDR
jgi:hypothetical protein